MSGFVFECFPGILTAGIEARPDFGVNHADRFERGILVLLFAAAIRRSSVLPGRLSMETHPPEYLDAGIEEVRQGPAPALAKIPRLGTLRTCGSRLEQAAIIGLLRRHFLGTGVTAEQTAA